MKVLFNLLTAGTYYTNILKRLHAQEWLEVVVIIPNKSGKNIGKGVKEERAEYPFKAYYLDEYITWYGKTFYRGFEEVVEKENPDVIIFHWPHILALTFIPGLYKRLRQKGIKLISREIPFGVPTFWEGITLRVNHVFRNEDNPNYRPILAEKIRLFFLTLTRRFYYPKIDAHLNYIDEALKILPSYGIKKDRIFVTYNSPDTDKLFEAKEKALALDPLLPENDYRLIHVGRLVKWKRVDMLIDAVDQLKDKYPKIELTIVGFGPEEDNLKKQVDELDLGDRITFTGGIYDPVLLGRTFLDASLYVLAGMGGLSINDAMVFDKPVLVSVCDGTEKKLVFENFNGAFFKEHNLDDLCNKIDFLFSDTERLKQFGENSCNIIEEKVNINTVIEGYNNAFNYVMKY